MVEHLLQTVASMILMAETVNIADSDSWDVAEGYRDNVQSEAASSKKRQAVRDAQRDAARTPANGSPPTRPGLP